MPKRRKTESAPTSIRLSAAEKESLRQEGRREQKEFGGPARSLHFMIVRAVRQWIAARQSSASEVDVPQG